VHLGCDLADALEQSAIKLLREDDVPQPFAALELREFHHHRTLQATLVFVPVLKLLQTTANDGCFRGNLAVGRGC
jgi:hypothetical protein